MSDGGGQACTMSDVTEPPVRTRTSAHPARTERIYIRLTEEELARLDECAGRDQRTRSDMARILINRGTEQ